MLVVAALGSVSDAVVGTTTHATVAVIVDVSVPTVIEITNAASVAPTGTVNEVGVTTTVVAVVVVVNATTTPPRVTPVTTRSALVVGMVNETVGPEELEEYDAPAASCVLVAYVTAGLTSVGNGFVIEGKLAVRSNVCPATTTRILPAYVSSIAAAVTGANRTVAPETVPASVAALGDVRAAEIANADASSGHRVPDRVATNVAWPPTATGTGSETTLATVGTT